MLLKPKGYYKLLREDSPEAEEAKERAASILVQALDGAPLRSCSSFISALMMLKAFDKMYASRRMASEITAPDCRYYGKGQK